MLADLLAQVSQCSACSLMSENRRMHIGLVPIRAKPAARVVFIGRDPSPRTATIVGDRGGRSVFINEIFRLVDAAHLSDDAVYITDVCKCHWRTSVGTPLPGTESRPAKIDRTIADTCISTWLLREVTSLQPKLIVVFGEEVYGLLRSRISSPANPPRMLSASRDKSTPDAERWFVENGPMQIAIAEHSFPLAVLRHPGNSVRLGRGTRADLRSQYHSAATTRVEALLSSLGAPDAA
jgi:uracil-DNA glycosylase